MGNTLFKEWTDNQLMVAFSLANADKAARSYNRKEEHFWRHAAYLANLDNISSPAR